MTYQLGIDLGTTYSAAAVRADDRVEVVTLGSRSGAVPSTVVVREDGELLFGETAAHRGMTEPDRAISEFKRRVGDNRSVRIGGTEMTAQTLMARYLAWIVDRVVERRGTPPTRIVLAHPANWGVHKLEALTAIVAESGISAIPTGSTGQPGDQPDSAGVVFVTEPVAAAVRYASEAKVETGAIIAVYDLGGGTFDATVMRKEANGFQVLGNPEGIEYLGGLDFDDALRHRVKLILGDDFTNAEAQPGFASAYAALTRDVRDAKEALSSEDAITIGVLLPGATKSIEIQRNEYEAMIRPSIEESVAAMRRCLRNADVDPSGIDHFLLVGGSSRTPLVGQLLEESLGVPLQKDTDPKYAVAEGAALFTSLVQASDAGSPLAAMPAPIAPAAAATAIPTAAPASAPAPQPGPAAAPAAPEVVLPEPGKQRSSIAPGVLVGAGLGLLIVLSGAFLLFDNNRKDDATVAGDSTTDEDIVAVLGTNVEASTQVAGAGQLLAPEVPSAENMVEVGGGTYIIGLDDSDGHVPARDATVEDYWIDAFEVTNAAYEPFVARGDLDAPLGWNNEEVPAGLEAHPVFGVSLADATLYCEASLKGCRQRSNGKSQVVEVLRGGIRGATTRLRWKCLRREPTSLAPSPTRPLLRGCTISQATFGSW